MINKENKMKKLTIDKVIAILKKSKQKEKQPDFFNIDCPGPDSSHFDLSRANLSGANLSDADFIKRNRKIK